jgi:hypothetical protein
MSDIDTPKDLSTLIMAVNDLAKAYACKPDGYFSINAFSSTMMTFIISNDLEEKFHDFVERECTRLAGFAEEVANKTKISESSSGQI